MTASVQKPARYIMIGGFLGAGKTTAVAQLGRSLREQGLRVGLISNDQSSGLVDTAMLKSHGFDVEEISGGCFCCRFNSLLDAANRLTAATRPDVFVAEPVGSCTDLVATVSYPLRRIYGDQFDIAPLSVLVDPQRCARVLGLTAGRSFSDKVVYVYRKQLEEADMVIVNKTDTLAPEELQALLDALRTEFPRAEVLAAAAREGLGLQAWFDRLLTSELPDQPTMAIDYDTYAEGEALLGWLNCTVNLEAAEIFDANALLVELSEALRAALNAVPAEIAHLKMTLDADDAGGQLSVVSVVHNDAPADLRESLIDGIRGGMLIINIRAEADPAALERCLREALEQTVQRGHAIRVTIEHLERLRPGRPEPTHRIQVAAEPQQTK